MINPPAGRGYQWKMTPCFIGGQVLDKRVIVMRRKETVMITWAIGLLAAFAAWTILIQCVDVQPLGQKGTDIGFAGFNVWFHRITGVHMRIYTITDWLGLVPVFICMGFGVLGFVQLIKRRSLFQVDPDIILLGLYYILVIFGYLFFEMVPINYRPVLIEGILEASYPSSTTLLVLSVMPTLVFQINRRTGNRIIRNATTVFAAAFSIFMVMGRLIAGVHWATDIIGAILLSAGLFMAYLSAVYLTDKRRTGRFEIRYVDLNKEQI